MNKAQKSLYPVLQSLFRWVFTVLLFFAAVMVEGQTAPIVLDIEVRGNEHVATEIILRRLINIRLGEPFSEKTVEKNARAIMDLGYFRAVDHWTEAVGSGIRIVFFVQENPLFKEFRLVGLETVSPAEFLACVEEKKGHVVNSVEINQVFREAFAKFQEKNGQLLTLDPAKTEIAPDGVVTIGLIELKLGKTIIKGLKKTAEFVVTRELSLQEGDLLNVNTIKEDLNVLRRLQIFEDIDLHFQPTSDPEIMDVVLELTEGQLIQFNFGFSYAPKTSELVGFGYITDPNFRGRGQQISFGLETNPGELCHFNLFFREPWLDEHNTSLSIRLYSDLDYGQEAVYRVGGLAHEYLYDLRSTGVEVSLGRPLQRNLRLSTSLQFELVETEFDSWVAPDYASLPLEVETYWNNSFGFGLVDDQRLLANFFYTTGGYLAQVNMNFYGGFLGGKYDYQKYVGEFKQFFSPGEYTTFGYRIRGGTLVGNVPETGFFLLGGTTSIRGYNNNFLQGDQLFLCNLELRQRFPGNDRCELVIFHDLGSVDYKEYYQGYGAGLRYITPLGQLRFDFAWTDRGADSGPKFHFLVQEMF